MLVVLQAQLEGKHYSKSVQYKRLQEIACRNGAVNFFFFSSSHSFFHTTHTSPSLKLKKSLEHDINPPKEDTIGKKYYSRIVILVILFLFQQTLLFIDYYSSMPKPMSEFPTLLYWEFWHQKFRFKSEGLVLQQLSRLLLPGEVSLWILLEVTAPNLPRLHQSDSQLVHNAVWKRNDVGRQSTQEERRNTCQTSQPGGRSSPAMYTYNNDINIQIQ